VISAERADLDDAIHVVERDEALRTFRKERRLVPFVVALVVVLAIIGGAILISGLTRATPGVVVGRYIGLDQAAAAAKAHQQGFTTHITDQHTDDVAGTVFDQNPKPGQLLRHGHTLSLFVSLGPAKVQVPPLVGLSVQDATAKLRSLGFQVSTPERVYNNNHAAGTVITSPSSGQLLLPGQPVQFTVSNGHAPVQVPPLTGVAYQKAKSQLQQLGFKVVRAADQNSETVPSGHVISVSPSGTEPYQSPVTVVVSKGPVYVTVPPVAGKGIDAACAAVESARLTCGTAFHYKPGAKVKYTVPAAGTAQRLGTQVDFYF
jgi:serine/threonine-protein kinase